MALTDNLISFWELEEASGTRVDAVVGTGNDLADNVGVGQQTGKVGNCAAFGGVNGEFLSHASNASLVAGDIDFTIAAWVYFDDLTVSRAIVGKWAAGGGFQYEYFLTYTGGGTTRLRLYAVVQTDTVIAVSADTLGVPSTATWYYVVAWHNSVANTLNIQVNNGVVDSNATGGPLQTGTAPLQFGIDDGFDLMAGRIDQVGFWKRILTADERTALYNGGAGLSYAAMASAADLAPSVADAATFTDEPTIAVGAPVTARVRDLIQCGMVVPGAR